MSPQVRIGFNILASVELAQVLLNMDTLSFFIYFYLSPSSAATCCLWELLAPGLTTVVCTKVSVGKDKVRVSKVKVMVGKVKVRE